VEQNKMLMPLTKMMKMLKDIQEIQPELMNLPKRILTAEQNVEKMKSAIDHQLVTHE
jgi:hypothetical protein